MHYKFDTSALAVDRSEGRGFGALGSWIRERDQSKHGIDGLKHRTAWAAAGDGVLFFDTSGDGQITEKREYGFTDGDPATLRPCARCLTRTMTAS